VRNIKGIEGGISNYRQAGGRKEKYSWQEKFGAGKIAIRRGVSQTGFSPARGEDLFHPVKKLHLKVNSQSGEDEMQGERMGNQEKKESRKVLT